MSFLPLGGGARSQTRRYQGTTAGQMGGVSGPRGASEEPREDQRDSIQRGETGNTARVIPCLLVITLYQMCMFHTMLSIAGCHTDPEEGGMEVSPGLLSMEQHSQGKRRHSSGQNVSVVITAYPLLNLLDS